MYKCPHCPYESKRAFDIKRHLARNKSCVPNVSTIVEGGCDTQNVNGTDTSTQNVNDCTSNDTKDVNVSTENVNVCTPSGTKNVNVGAKSLSANGVNNGNGQNELICKCGKSNFRNTWEFNKHMGKCNGLNSLQCPTCHRWFSSRQAKYQHKKNVKCEPVVQNIDQSVHNDNSTHHDNSTHTTINDNSVNTNNITNNNTLVTADFGQENLDHLVADDRLIARVVIGRMVASGDWPGARREPEGFEDIKIPGINLHQQSRSPT